MPQVVVAVVSAIGSAFSAVAAFAGANAFAAAIVKVALSYAVSAVASALFAPKLKNTAQRQADVLTMQLGEGPRVAIFGEAATGGSLADAFNHGTNNEWEVVVIALADHECEALTGFIVNDTKYTFTSNGQQAAFNEGSTASLYLYWYPGTVAQTASTYLTTNSGGRWTSDDKFTGVSYVVAAYRYSQVVWPQGRPRFKWIVKGAKCYDPRLDDTVDGGAGAHRWGTPSTYAWSNNAAVCEFNWRRGVWSNGQLMVGPGRSPEEAPADAFTLAAMNLCDENVSLKAGGTEKRYRASAVILANERWIDTQADFARAMAGDLIDRAGVTQPDPGASKSVAMSFTDDNLIEGARCEFRKWLTRDESVNTISTRYVEPTKLYQPHSAPLRRNQDDIDTDGEPREAPLELPFVTSNTQAQRIGEILRRKGRLQRQATVTLGPQFMALETGDWVEWTSDTYASGATVTFEVRRVRYMSDGTIELGLREIAANCFSWTAASDELDDTSQGFVAGPTPGAASLSGWTVTPVTVSNGGAVTLAIKTEWTPAEDNGIQSVLIEWRKTGTTTPVFSKLTKYRQGKETLAEGLVSGAQFDVRATPKTAPARTETATSWTTVTVGTAVASSIVSQGDLATTNRAALPFGQNAAPNSEFRASATWPQTGYLIGGRTGAVGTFTSSLVTAGPRRAVKCVTSGSPASANYMDLWVWDITGDPAKLARHWLPVVAGDRVAASALVAKNASCSSVYVGLFFFDASGAYLSEAAGSSVTATANGDSGNPTDYALSSVVATAPANARFAAILPRAIFNGGASPTAWCMSPMLALVPSNQTAVPAYTPTPRDRLGDVTNENTAAAITGQGDLATTNRAALPFGGNAVINSDFTHPGTYPPSGFQAGWNGNTGLTNTYAIRTGARIALEASQTGTPSAAGTVFDIAGVSAGTLSAQRRYCVPVVAGERIAASMLFAHNSAVTACYLYIAWYDASGAYVSEQAGTFVTNVADGSTANPGNFAASTLTMTAPTNARFAQIVARVSCSGAADPKAWCMAPLVCHVPANQTGVPAYTPGPPDRFADYTIANTAAAITGQSVFATTLSLNINGGVSGTFSVAPIGATGPTSIAVTGCTWTGIAGSSIVIPSATITGLANATRYWIFRDTVGATFVTTSSYATAITYYNDATGRYLALGAAYTQTSGGTGGGGAGGGGGVWP